MDYFEDKELEQHYIANYAKYKICDFVAYFDRETSKYIIGVVHKIKVDRIIRFRRFGNIQVPVVRYIIATPNGFVKKYQSEVFNVADYLNALRNG